MADGASAQQVLPWLLLRQVAACTQAGIVPPENWENGCLSIVVDARVQLLANAALTLLETIPAALLPLVSRGTDVGS